MVHVETEYRILLSDDMQYWEKRRFVALAVFVVVVVFRFGF